MKPILVAMLLHSYHPIVGGAERQLQALLPYLRARNVEAVVLTRRYPGLASFSIVEETPVYRLRAPGPKPLAALSFIFSTIFHIWRLKPDVIHAYDLMSPTTAALLARMLFKIPVVAKVLSGGPKGDIDRIRHSWGGESRLRVLKRRVDKFVVISQEIAAELDAIGERQCQYAFIPNGVDLELYKPTSPAQRTEIRHALNLPADVPIALFVGRLIPEKRPQNLLLIWDAARARFPDAALVMVGSGPDAHKLEKMHVKGVHFVGQSNNVLAYLQAADIFVLPSAREGLSNALLEAQASGVPAIATSIGAAPELIENGVNGLIVAVDDIPALQASVLRLLGDVRLRQQFAAAGRKRVMENYSLQSTAKQLANLYHQLVAAGVQ
jgi:glycosyltransferase involved in cell wall biosynthesis